MKTIYIDASAIKQSACFKRFYQTVVDGYRSPFSVYEADYGTAFHLFVSTWKQTGDESEGLRTAIAFLKGVKSTPRPSKSWLSTVHLAGVIAKYLNTYEKDCWKTCYIEAEPKSIAAVEQKFIIPFMREGDAEIVLAGTMDDICYHTTHKGLAVRDYKTTSVWDIKNYLKAYALSPQLIFYVYCLKQLNKLYPGKLKLVGLDGQIGAFIDGIFLKSKLEDVVFARSDVFYFKDSDILAFEDLLVILCKKVLDAYHGRIDGYKPEGIINGACETHYGLCSFFNVCNAPSKDASDFLLKSSFKQREYNPLKFGEQGQ